MISPLATSRINTLEQPSEQIKHVQPRSLTRLVLKHFLKKIQELASSAQTGAALLLAFFFILYSFTEIKQQDFSVAAQRKNTKEGLRFLYVSKQPCLGMLIFLSW